MWNFFVDGLGNDRSNDYLVRLHALQSSGQGRYGRDKDGVEVDHRRNLSKMYSWAIPNKEAIHHIVLTLVDQGISDLVSVGAGTGFWEMLISRAWNGSVHAYDIDPPPTEPGEPTENAYRHDRQHFPVKKGDSSVAAKFGPKSALLLSWPPYESSMAFDTLTAFNGDLLFYVGEGYGGCTGDYDFHDLLDERWEFLHCHDLPRWDGIRDDLCTFRRK